MTNEQMKAAVKKHFGLDITDEQTEAFFAKYSGKELSEEELDKVFGAVSDGGAPSKSDKEILSVNEFFKKAKESIEEMFHPASEGFNKGVDSLKRGLRGEGVQSRENKENLRNVLKGKAKW